MQYTNDFLPDFRSCIEGRALHERFPDPGEGVGLNDGPPFKRKLGELCDFDSRAENRAFSDMKPGFCMILRACSAISFRVAASLVGIVSQRSEETPGQR